MPPQNRFICLKSICNCYQFFLSSSLDFPSELFCVFLVAITHASLPAHILFCDVTLMQDL